MATVIQIKSLADVTGSHNGENVNCWVFAGEPTPKQMDYCLQNGISIEFASHANHQTEWSSGMESQGAGTVKHPVSVTGSQNWVVGYGVLMIVTAGIALLVTQ